MSISYLLDTSALRALSGEVIQNFSNQHAHLFVSPYCFWEILCHLDEHENFVYFRTQLTKFKYVKVLDDPYATFYTPFLPNEPELQERVSDDDIIYPMLAALQSSDCLKTFYAAYIRDSKARIRQISDCAARARKTLDNHEANYTHFINEIIKALDSGQLELETEEDRHQRILELIEGEVIKLKEKGASDIKLREKVIENSYIYCSYIFHRALKYFRSGTTTIDQNDYEDSKVCLHLKLQTPYCLVTNDKGMRVALVETISLLKRLNQPHFFTTLQVKSIESIQNYMIV